MWTTPTSTGQSLADFNRDGKVDIVYGNWNGPHRLYLQMSAHGEGPLSGRRGLSPFPTLPYPPVTPHQGEQALQSLGAGWPQ